MANSAAPTLDIAAPEEEQGRSHGEKKRLPLLGQYLHEQNDLSAVERFAQQHEDVGFPLQQRYYKSLIPASPPGPGQQYAFQVDLDRCSGCKACVTACHSLNGLDHTETWRSVGLLHGGTASTPVQKTVTTACHHCLEPACLKGCPVRAYEKDPVTGIVRHLDDQCIGCQYCVLTCPYEVPQFNVSKGIVRKCDMCSDRLADGEAPACVQACPTEAISIAVVGKSDVERQARDEQLVPEAPDSALTLPTTTYKSTKPLPDNLRPGNFHSVQPAAQHMPLVLMLVLTQLSAGVLAVDQLLPRLLSDGALAAARPLYSLFALAIAVLALGASTSHLGRPQYAFRAVLGVRTSWLSREILAFGAFAGGAALHAGIAIVPELGALADELGLSAVVGAGVAGIGLMAVFCSVMLYHVTGRRWWRIERTGARFFGTAAMLGVAAVTCCVFATAFAAGTPLDAESIGFGRAMAITLALCTALKLAWEATALLALRKQPFGELTRSALLLTGPLAMQTRLRYGAGLIGGIALPLVALTQLGAADAARALGAAAASLSLLLAGELLERMNFFSAASAPRMPGTLS